MALGNSNPKRGDKGSRFSYELGQLKVLNKILEALGNLDLNIGDVILNTDDIENLLQGINGSEETPDFSRVSNNVGLLPGFFSVAISNVGAATGTVLGADLPAGDTVKFCAKTGNRLGAIAYDATLNGGTTFAIVTTKIV